MRTEVTIDGIKLTREQIELAYKRLQEPKFNPGDDIRFVGPGLPPNLAVSTVFKVLGGSVKRVTDVTLGKDTRDNIVTFTDGCSTWSIEAFKFVKVER